MSFFIAKNESPANEALDSNMLMKLRPEYYGPRFEAISDLRKIDDGTLHRGSGFRRVASLVNVPLANAVATVLDPEWMKNKNKFYRWLDSGDNWRYCTYDRRRGARPISNQVTFFEGKEL